jgi:hypothetical protein
MKLILYPTGALKASSAPFGTKTECESLASFAARGSRRHSIPDDIAFVGERKLRYRRMTRRHFVRLPG